RCTTPFLPTTAANSLMMGFQLRCCLSWVSIGFVERCNAIARVSWSN
ncbi:MAG: hypothetical protein IGR91_21940, partial [Fischerella thermalis M66_A2018_004]|nr:hypothetical protein [Fischerella thermalis M66_A2018_004]